MILSTTIHSVELIYVAEISINMKVNTTALRTRNKAVKFGNLKAFASKLMLTIFWDRQVSPSDLSSKESLLTCHAIK